MRGRLTGLLAEIARDAVRDAIPAPSEADIVDAIERGGQHLLSICITSCVDAAVGQRAGFGEIAAYMRAKRDGRGTSLTAGFWSRAMMISSPASAWAMSWE